MALEVQHGRLPCLVVPSRVERDAVSSRNAFVAFRRKLRPGAAEGEVDVEEDGAYGHRLSSSNQRTPSMCLRMYLLSNAQATVCPTVQPRARSRSSPSSDVSRSSLCKRSDLLYPNSWSRTIGATANSRSPTSGFGSIASHGSRCAARTLSP